jgi:dephospho-CoA kinase
MLEILSLPALPANSALRVGLTGGIGSGKSTVTSLLQDMGAMTIDADAIVAELTGPDGQAVQKVTQQFGKEVISTSGGVDRRALAKVIFDDAEAREALEAIIHPMVSSRATAFMDALPPNAVGIYDVPLLTETRMQHQFDLVVVVEAPLSTKLERLEKRGLSREQSISRMRNQSTDAERRAIANIIVVNAGTSADLAKDAEHLWHLFKHKKNL